MSAERLSVESLEDAALDNLFQQGLRLRLYVAPFIFLGAMLILVWERATWRLTVTLGALVFVATRAVYEFVRARRGGLQRGRLSALLHVPAVVLMTVVVSSGGVDSPVVVMMPLVAVFLTMFLHPKYGRGFAIFGVVLVLVLTVVQGRALVPDLLPAVFGGGARSSATDAMLYTRAAFICIGLFWAVAVGWVMRNGYRTAIQKALDAREDALRTREDTRRTLTTLVAEIAHELKNPLASVKGLAQLVDKDVDGRAKERLDVLRREVDRMQEILESFLTFTRPLVPLDVEPVDLVQLAEQVLALHEGIITERGLALRLNAKTGLSVKGDARKLKQVLINLVQNALDVTAEGGAVDVVVAPDGRGARISVMDRGPGVADVERAFVAGHTTKEKGSGLGLTVSRMVARQHGGDVTLAPRDGGGTIAALLLPEAP
jgi:signal transduction histidine kinase